MLAKALGLHLKILQSPDDLHYQSNHHSNPVHWNKTHLHNPHFLIQTNQTCRRNEYT